MSFFISGTYYKWWILNFNYYYGCTIIEAVIGDGFLERTQNNMKSATHLVTNYYALIILRKLKENGPEFQSFAVEFVDKRSRKAEIWLDLLTSGGIFSN